MRKFIMVFLGFLYFCVADTNAATLRNSVEADDCLCSVGNNHINILTHKITLAQAKALVMAALTPEERRAPGVGIEPTDADNIFSYKDPDHPRFLTFNVIWDAPADSSINIGFYAVDIYTGDVFDAVAVCAEYYGKKLALLQKKIRHSLHLTNVEYRKLKANGPECVGGN